MNALSDERRVDEDIDAGEESTHRGKKPLIRAAGRRWVDVAAIVVAAIVALAALALALPGYFWSDDWVVLSQLANEGLTPGRMITPHGGHLQPGSYAVFRIATLIGGSLPWSLMSVLGAVILFVALAATWAAIRTLVGRRPLALLPMLAVAVASFTYTCSSWAIVSVTVLPVWISSAAAIVFHVRYLRSSRRRDMVLTILAVVAGLFFLEKAIVIPIVLFLLTAAWFVRGPLWASLAATWRACRSEWVILLVIMVPYAYGFLTHLEPNSGPPDLGGILATYVAAVALALPMAMTAGPWHWFSLGNPNASPSPPNVLALFALITAACLVAGSVIVRKHAARVWLPLLIYMLVAATGLVVGRADALGWGVALTSRYYADGAALLAGTLAVAYLGLRDEESDPYRPSASAQTLRVWLTRPVVAPALCLALVVSGLISAVAYAGFWQQNPGRTYSDNYQASLAAQPGVALFNDFPPVTAYGLLFPIAPWDTRKEMFQVYPLQPTWVEQSETLNVIAADGTIVPGTMFGTPLSMPDPNGCAFLTPSLTLDVPRQGPAVFRFLSLRYTSAAAGTMTAAYGGVVQTFPIREGTHEEFLSTGRDGDQLAVSVNVPSGAPVCLSGAVVGQQVARPPTGT